MTELTTVPNFIFSQGNGEDISEPDVQVKYWVGAKDNPLIELKQGNNEILFENVEQLVKLVKEVKRHLPDAIRHLEK